MTPLVSRPVGVSELVAGAPARPRLHGLDRLTAPTRSPWFWVALWISAIAAGFVALIPVTFDHGPPVPAHEVIHNLSGVSFMACGLVAWRRRPDSAVGPMLTVAGFGVL